MDETLQTAMREYMKAHAEAFIAQALATSHVVLQELKGQADTPKPAAPTPKPAAITVPKDWACPGNWLEQDACPHGDGVTPAEKDVRDKEKGQVRLCVECHVAYKRAKNRINASRRAAAKKKAEPEPEKPPAKKAKPEQPPKKKPAVEEEEEEDEEDEDDVM